MKLSPRGQFTWSVVFFFSCFFFPRSHCFFSQASLLIIVFLCPAILEPKFFSGNSYLLLQPTSLPPPDPSTSPYLPHHPFSLPSMARASEPPGLVGFMVCPSKAWSEELVDFVELEAQRGSSSNSGSLHINKRSGAFKVSVFFSCFFFFFFFFSKPRWRVTWQATAHCQVLS